MSNACDTLTSFESTVFRCLLYYGILFYRRPSSAASTERASGRVSEASMATFTRVTVFLPHLSILCAGRLGTGLFEALWKILCLSGWLLLLLTLLLLLLLLLLDFYFVNTSEE